jgi:hypothetical protein
MWIKKSLVFAAWAAAALVGVIVLLVINDNGGLDLKTTLVIGGCVVWYAVAKQLDRNEKASAERHSQLMARIRTIETRMEQSEASLEHRLESAKMLAELRRVA